MINKSLSSLLIALLWPLQLQAVGYVYTGVGGWNDLMELTSVDVQVTIQDRIENLGDGYLRYIHSKWICHDETHSDH